MGGDYCERVRFRKSPRAHILTSHSLVPSISSFLRLHLAPLRPFCAFLLSCLSVSPSLQLSVSSPASQFPPKVVHAAVLLYWDAAISEVVTAKLEALALVFGAAIHDYRHPGVSNNFLRHTEHDIYLTHADESTLERFHVGQAFLLLNNDRLNFMANMKPSERILFRMLVTRLVLATGTSAQQLVVVSSLSARSMFSLLGGRGG